MTGRVLKAVAGRFYVATEEGVRETGGRGKCKRDDRILVGDYVRVTDDAIESVLPRRNRLIRPAVANVDRIVIVLAPVPEPDLMLADKLVIYADSLGIPVIVALNKSDLDVSCTDSLRAQYAAAVRSVVSVSAVTRQGIDDLKRELSNGFSVLAGQSAVGKSSLLNALGGCELMETGEVGARSGRGRHTTRHTEIFACGDGWIADTPGFSMLDGAELDLKEEDADLYYTDLFAVSRGCRYNRCTHTHEPDCAVKAEVREGRLNAERYKRYVRLREELKKAKSYE